MSRDGDTGGGSGPVDKAAVRQRTAFIVDAILQERTRQDQKWGGPSHDDEHGRRDWIAFIVDQLGDASKFSDCLATQAYEAAMVKVAALAIASIESTERKAYRG